MQRWGLAHEAEPDAKARELVNYLVAVCRPDGQHWTNERVVVFTEYRDTQRWLAGLLRQHGIDAPRLALLHGGIGPDEREQLRLAFQADPAEHPVRILVATDAASEGIDLQNHCHWLVNYDIPFNPNRLEQRIGRVDRYGQRHAPDIRHFVGTGWRHAVDSYEADLEFLSRVATKVARMEADLGPVNAVLADAVQRRMLGEIVDLDVDAAGGQPGVRTPELPVDRDVRQQVVRLREQLDRTVADLGITPHAIRRVVGTALELARQQPLRPHLDERHAAEGLFDVAPLTGSWERATAGLTEKLEVDDRTPRQLPVTFDPETALDRRNSHHAALPQRPRTEKEARRPYRARSADRASCVYIGGVAVRRVRLLLMSAEREELRQLVERLPDEEVPAVLVEVRRRVVPAVERSWPPAFFGAGRAGRGDVAGRVEEILSEGFGRQA